MDKLGFGFKHKGSRRLLGEGPQLEKETKVRRGWLKAAMP